MRINRLFLLALLFFQIGCAMNVGEKMQMAAESLDAGDGDKAKSIYQSILDYQPVYPDAIAGMVAVAKTQNATGEYRHWSRELLKYRPWDRDANIAVGQEELENGDLKEAAVRFMLAFQNSDFQNDKKEAMMLLNRIRDRIIANSTIENVTK